MKGLAAFASVRLPLGWLALPAAVLAVGLALVPARRPVEVTTYHNDLSRTGLNPREALLTPANVNARQFGLRFTHPVDAFVYAQPLSVPGVAVPGKGVHNVVFAATGNGDYAPARSTTATPPASTWARPSSSASPPSPTAKSTPAPRTASPSSAS